jgi:cytochrome c peroxidase
MRLPNALPPARGNAHADVDEAARLGFQLFFRADLGRGVSCATCHDPTFAFSDRLPVPNVRGFGPRNAPTTLNAARLSVFFWDGRSDSLWSQPLFAIENSLEMNSSRLEVAHLVAADASLKPLYEKAFGPMPDLSRLPASGKPGDPSFDSLSAGDQDTVNRIGANVGKAFEAYERKNTSGEAALDRYLDGDSTAIIDEAKKGLAIFIRAGCASCHAGPMFTDEKFHALGFPLLNGAAHDPGALAGVRVLQGNVFNLSGPYADRTTGTTPPAIDLAGAVDGAFRTPSLRMVAETAPYGHNGVFPTLRDLLAVHAAASTDEERGRLIAFLHTLTGDLPPLPWSTWPSPR